MSCPLFVLSPLEARWIITSYGTPATTLLYRLQSWPRKSEQGDKWNFCLTAGTLCPERTGGKAGSRRGLGPMQRLSRLLPSLCVSPLTMRRSWPTASMISAGSSSEAFALSASSLTVNLARLRTHGCRFGRPRCVAAPSTAPVEESSVSQRPLLPHYHRRAYFVRMGRHLGPGDLLFVMYLTSPAQEGALKWQARKSPLPVDRQWEDPSWRPVPSR